jgi:pSer/pThr/pTyr-binding forkhead associated (FHA) protein
MRIEILVDNQEPRIYPLDKPKIVVGSHEACDIVINHKGISRKHCIITEKEDKYFVADQGSTNGSYIDEHRLVPGNAAEFSSFFPVRLGDNVLMSLLSDEEAQDLGGDTDLAPQNASGLSNDESTKMISIKDLQKSNTSGLVQKRAETVTKRKTVNRPPPVKKKSVASNLLMGVIAVLIIAAAAFYQYLNKQEAQVFIAQKKVAQVIVDNRPILRLEEENLPTAESIVAVAKNPKCSTDLEKNLCITLPLIYQEIWGTVLMDKTVLILANGVKYLQDAKAYVKIPNTIEQGGTPAESNAYQSDLHLVALMLWIKDNIPLEVKKIDGLKDLSLTIAFVDIAQDPPVFVSAAVFVPESLLRLRMRIQDKDFLEAKERGASEFVYAFEYLRFL